MYSLLIFMTKLAAASGVNVFHIKKHELLEPSASEVGGGGGVCLLASAAEVSPSKLSQIKLSEEIIWSGQVYPMIRVQFTIHARRLNKPGEVTRAERIFGAGFKRSIFKGNNVESAKIVAVTDMQGHEFAGHSTSDMRSSLLSVLGTVTGFKEIDASAYMPSQSETAAAKWDCTEFVMHGLERFMIEQMDSVFNLSQKKRLSFFVSCKTGRVIKI